MGTRNLIAVMVGGEYKIAQYAQWDGYPDGQGLRALDFARSLLEPAKRERFVAALGRVRWLTDDEGKAAAEKVGCKDGWMNMEQADRYNELLPYVSRNHGARILDLVTDATGEVPLFNSIGFAKDSLFCEWAYVLDLDKNALEVFWGLQKDKAPPAGNRFGSDRKEGEGLYYPVALARAWKLDDLPSNEAFLAAFATSDDDA